MSDYTKKSKTKEVVVFGQKAADTYLRNVDRPAEYFCIFLAPKERNIKDEIEKEGERERKKSERSR